MSFIKYDPHMWNGDAYHHHVFRLCFVSLALVLEKSETVKDNFSVEVEKTFT